VRRVVHLGFEVRVELTLQDGGNVWAQVTRETAQQLELEEGQILAVRVPAPRVFRSEPPAAAPTQEQPGPR
jgi:sulfate/thiosulfate transport system ATP-binding protein